jgi:hypothetical protein
LDGQGSTGTEAPRALEQATGRLAALAGRFRIAAEAAGERRRAA